MYSLKDFLVKVGGMNEKNIPSDLIFCIEANSQNSLIANAMTDFIDCFSFTLTIKGHCTILYKGEKIRLEAKDFHIYSPASSIEVIEISDDYKGLCLIADKSLLFKNSVGHNVIKSVYFPMMRLDFSKIHLSDLAYRRIYLEMREVIANINSKRRLKTEASQLVFSLMLLDLIEFLERHKDLHHSSHKEETLVVEFIKLVSANFINQHNIKFYSDKLNISSIYLSRIVKHSTGKTVMNHINDLLAKEADWLLRSTGKSIKEIAEMLNFADQASFNKFFNRMRGVSPSAFRSLAM